LKNLKKCKKRLKEPEKIKKALEFAFNVWYNKNVKGTIFPKGNDIPYK
jgi:hypothetical protein